MLIYVQVYHEYIRNIWVRVLQYFFEFLSFVGTTLYSNIVLYYIEYHEYISIVRCVVHIHPEALRLKKIISEDRLHLFECHQ
jgi:hypothetical protein